ncbi:iron chelate uptake ABC transporter family permease subunit [Solwaraspora sp. WMMD406]|uniref:FecCD family ABC transporter permease n=1 Tax=Solwaraspora sp. WMMD406 TaxID=3016095 RepID=UPI002416AF29|nr:iron chelate uptake ABC transporter family permease subunit [Solwaraspora sp. WMMD406]MDG4764128.1 iron chelate uptake ABC transporter family permease subunit [Solwaraspora sp. WMMD406]
MLTSLRPGRRGHSDETTTDGVRDFALSRKLGGLLVAVLLLALTVFASLALGSRDIALPVVVEALLDRDPAVNDHVVVWDLRLPRTVIGLLAGLALGLSGALMQGLTRNPIADPGLLGINAGASLAVVVAITWLGIGTTAGYIWFAFGGAALAALLVYGVGSMGWGGATPVKLAIAGSALTAVLTSLITLVLLTNLQTLERYRFWQVGSLVGRDLSTARTVLLFVVLGTVVAFVSGRVLNALSLGDDVAHGLGQHVVRDRATILAAIVLLCGSATALAGPIVFVGLVVPHAARWITGPDYRWIIAYSAVFGAAGLVAADVVGRLIAPPGEVEAGLVAAFLGAPVLIALVRRSRLASV